MFTKLYYKLIGFLVSRPKLKALTWKYWYPYVTRRLKETDVVFLNYAFVDETTGPSQLELEPEDETDRACISLYHHLACQINLEGKHILEVSCGHGGGASFISRYHHPQRLTALDLNPEGIRFCKGRHRFENLDFIRGNALSLPLADNSVDVVLNVEASHGYGNFNAFIGEVARVLKPGGHFLYADFRVPAELETWESELNREEFQLMASREINPEVLKGMDQNSKRSNQLIAQSLPFYFRPAGRVFAGIKGTRIYNALQNKTLIYRSYCLQRSS
ncbi:MAG: methyltransferase domain-containing protein [bacterium]|nr:methyltransferase domain-containing protein [bacterium]